VATLFDLGPGYPDKALALCLSHKDNVHYIAVDINEKFLSLAVSQMRNASLSARGIRSLFEEIKIEPKTVLTNGEDNIVMLGLTFMNIDPNITKSIFTRFSSVAKKFCVAAKLVTERDEATLNPYRSEVAKKFSFGPLQTLGAEISAFNYSVEYQDCKLVTIFESKTEQMLGDETFPMGTKFITTSSYRYNIAEYNSVIKTFLKNPVSFSSEDGMSIVTLGEILQA
jgi:hypothetical protein